MSERIRPIWEDLVNNLQYAEDIAEQLQLTRTLTSNDVEVIQQKQNTPRQMKHKLLVAIQTKEAYDVFAQCLRVTGQDPLYQLMVRTGPVQPVTDELSTLQYRVYCEHEIGDPKNIQVPPHIQQLLETQREALQGMKKVERLVDLMEDEGCLTSMMTREIKQQPGNKDKVNMLVDGVIVSTLYSYFALTRFLDISEQDNLMSEREKDTNRALGRMDDLQRNIYYNLLGAIALKHNELEERLGMNARDFVTLSINRNPKAVDRRGLNEAHVDQSAGTGIKLKELFSGTENNKPTQKVLLIGAPGAGKTTAVMELARKATAKNTPSIPRPPFVIQLCRVDWKQETTLKNLLLLHGPSLPATEQNQIWRALSRNPEEITIFLDGADEVRKGFFNCKPAPVIGTENRASPKDILNNLISGKLLEGAKVLVSSRPYDLQSCWDNFDRKVEVCGFNEKSLTSFLQNELPPQHLTEVQSFLETRADIRSLLLTPLHAATFVLRAKTTEDTKDLLLESSTELSLSLIDSLVKTKLRKVHGKKIPEVGLEKQGKNLLKICKLIAQLLCSEGAIKTEMTHKDLEKEISVEECVETGVFIEQVLDEDDVCKRILMVHHQSILESLAALGLEEQQILKLVAENHGRHDLVLTYVVGILGSKKGRKMLKYILSEDDEAKDLNKLAEVVGRAILGSKRRVLRGGEEFCQRIVVESQQWGLIPDLMRVMGKRWLTNLRDSSEQLMLADQLIRHDPCGNASDPLVRVEVSHISEMRYCPRATGLFQLGYVTAACIRNNVKHLRNMSSISFSASAGITRETVADFAAELSKLNVEAVRIYNNKVGSTSGESSVLRCLSWISSLKYLSLYLCGLSSDDVVAITSSCHNLLHLDIGDNDGIRGEDVKSSHLTGLCVAEWGLEGNAVVEMAANNGKTLTFLNARHNPVLTSSHINAILTHCPRLVELYTDYSGELVRALSKRHTACRLNHLWLCDCDLSSSSSFSCCTSSSSSSDHQVNSSELRDVLARHPTISSLTLQGHNFTPEVMSHLSSSMASITSLFISPQPHFRPYSLPRSADVVSLICRSPGLKQLWLGSGEWRASDYMKVIRAVNASPALRVLGLDVERALTLDEIRVVVKALTRRLTRLWLRVDRRKGEEYREVVLKGELGVIQLVPDSPYCVSDALYETYIRESGLFYQHLPPSLTDWFRPNRIYI